VTEGVYTQNLAHVTEGVGHLIDFFRRGPRNRAGLSALLQDVQELEDQIWAVHGAFDVDSAVGQQLDFLGGIVGEVRGGRSDGDYRAAIRVRILVNASDGKPEQLIAICIGISPAASVELTEQYPASIRVRMSTLGTASLQTTYMLLQQAKPAGVRLLLSAGVPTIGAVDGNPAGGIIGAVDGNPAGFVIAGGT